MNRYSFTMNGYTFTRINRTKARTAYAHGLPVLACPCNLRPGFPWHPETIFDPRQGAFVDRMEFDSLDNAFTFYNCINSETGKRPAYYIPVRTVDGVESYDYSYMEGGKERG